MATGSWPWRYSSTRASVTLSGRGDRGVELEHPAAADLVNGPGAVRVTAEPRARQAEAGREVFRGGPDELSSQTTACHSWSVRTAGSMRGDYPGPQAARN